MVIKADGADVGVSVEPNRVVMSWGPHLLIRMTRGQAHELAGELERCARVVEEGVWS